MDEPDIDIWKPTRDGQPWLARFEHNGVRISFHAETAYGARRMALDWWRENVRDAKRRQWWAKPRAPEAAE